MQQWWLQSEQGQLEDTLDCMGKQVLALEDPVEARAAVV
jgi:hypothetical protein